MWRHLLPRIASTPDRGGSDLSVASVARARDERFFQPVLIGRRAD